ncbi:MAG: phosphotransferase family protein [Caldilineaceae bacterium]|nr:phosphotransferase family protein [Caldilineaceae bacterium]
MQDTIPVRDDEQIDGERVAAFLWGKLPGSDQPLAVRQFGGGAANLTYHLDYGSHEYVLRRPPLGPVPPSAHDMARESKVLSTLWQAYPYAPRAFLFSDDKSVVGAPFFVMERRQGLVVRKRIPPAYAAIPDAPRRMSEALVDALADLHAVDYTAIGLADLGRPAGFVGRQIEGWWRRWQATELGEEAAMTAVYGWLLANQPAEGVPSLIHNDYKLDNVMLAPQDPGRLVAIFDWDMCTLGDPLSDVGALLAYWSLPDDPPHFQALAMMPIQPGFLRREELVARYAARSGRDVSQIHFYHALSLFRVVVIIAQIYVRFVRGQTQDQRFAAFGPVIPAAAQAALDVAQGARGTG